MRLSILAALAAVSLSCATAKVSLKSAPPADVAALNAAVNSFYSAQTVTELERAAVAARAASPDSALAHELAAELCDLKGDPRGFVRELISALQDANDPDPILHMHRLNSVEWTPSEEAQILALLDTLSVQAPSEATRAAAAFRLAGLWTQAGRLSDAAVARGRIAGRLDLAVIGGWDNDQGKAFKSQLPPEGDGFLKTAEYEGMLRPLRWRTGLPTDGQGSYVLSNLLQPARFAVAFATGTFSLQQAQPVELRLRTTEPVLVYVDGKVLAEVRDVRETFFDHVVLPVSLPAGPHRVMIKVGRMDKFPEWNLLARVTGPSGAALPSLSLLAPDADVVAAASKVAAVSEDQLFSGRFPSMEGQSPRALAVSATYWRFLLGGPRALKVAERYTTANHDALMARLSLLAGLWSNSETGRASDQLAAIAADVKAALPSVSLMRARTWRQQGLRQKARAQLIELLREHPDDVAVRSELADLFDEEKWTEDECEQSREVMRLLEGSTASLLRAASCALSLSRDSEAEALYRRAVQQSPGSDYALRRLAEFAAVRGQWSLAEWAMRERVRVNPAAPYTHLALGDTLEHRDSLVDARAEYQAAAALAPDAPNPYASLARLEYRAGNKDQAVAAWREALARNPEDENLANRIEFLAPERPEAWQKDIPDEAALEAAVKKARALKPIDGANTALVLDHEVAAFKGDGTMTSVVTTVMRAFGADGRDALLKHSIGGRSRIRAAYAVDDDGRRVEPVSVRGGEVRFRALGERSIVVLQYRRDVASRGVLGHYLNLDWHFQSLTDAHIESQYVLYLPKGIELKESRVGEVERQDSEVEGLHRIVWSARDVLPGGVEVSMPPRRDVTRGITLSTVPSWEVFSQWTQALFQDAMRESPEVKAVASQLFDGVADKNQRLLRLQAWMMKEIRYEQDYESMISGVKPHPAPMVLERRYGDCKDKTVLFMTLARLGDIDTRYALIRTRDLGPVREAVPDQQFNHVIVYVPEQPGVAAAQYFDPTADALDVSVLRSDDAGTTSFVIDPKTRSWKFQKVPFQPGSDNAVTMELAVALNDDGSALVRAHQSLVGDFGSAVRRGARNKDYFKRALGSFANAIYAGSTLQSVDVLPDTEDVWHPAEVGISFKAPNAARREGDELRLVLPASYSAMGHFKLPTRRHPLVMGIPQHFHYSGEVKLPTASVLRVPQSTKFESPCLDFSRRVTVADGAIRFEQDVDEKCDLIQPQDYPAALQAAVAVQKLLEEDAVFSLAKTPSAPSKSKKVKVAPQASQTPP